MQTRKKNKKNSSHEKNTTSDSRNPSGSGMKLKVLDQTFKRVVAGEDAKLLIHAPEKTDSEKGPMPDDEAARLKYPPPKRHPTFRKVWAQFIDNVATRENFKIGHLNALEILCDLYVQYEELQEYVRIHGRTYLSVGRQGEQWKPYPEVLMITKVQSQIKEYMRMLDLILKKDHNSGNVGGQNEWV